MFGIRKLSTLNQALMSKWGWRFATKTQALRNSLIRLKYGEERGDWSSNLIKGRYRVTSWKPIRAEWKTLEHYISSKAGKEQKQSNSGQQHGVTVNLLLSLFPNLYNMSTKIEAIVADMFSIGKDLVSWFGFSMRFL